MQNTLGPDTIATQRHATITDYRSRINAAMLFIGQHAGQNLDISAIAAEANFSAFHFHRIFAAYVGDTVWDYVKRIRMIKAATLLVSQTSIAEVAAQSGYETTSAFIQVFKKTYGVTPQLFKQTKQLAQVYYPFKSVRKPSDKLNLIAEIREIPALTIFYVRKKGLVDQNYTKVADEAFEVLFRFLNAKQVRNQVVHRLGIIHDMGLISAEDCRFDAGVTLLHPASLVPADEVCRVEIAAGKWAVFSHKGAYNTLWQTWNWIYQYWYPTSGLELRDVAPFEVYLNHPFTTPPEDLLTEIYLPIR